MGYDELPQQIKNHPLGERKPFMNSLQPHRVNTNNSISSIEVTTDCLADRGGLPLVMRYLACSGLIARLAGVFKRFRFNQKGISVENILCQLIAFLLDGTSRHLTRFDELKRDPGYAATLETSPEQMASSHVIKRFFNKTFNFLDRPLRAILRDMVISRICHEKPEVIELFLDTMVLDNDDANQRQGVSPTYKKVKGFQPLHLIWDGQVIDAQFRGGKKHCNHGDVAFHMIKKVVQLIRSRYDRHVPIIVRMDAGFFDGELFWKLDVNNIGFVCSGRMSDVAKETFKAFDSSYLHTYQAARQSWHIADFGYRCKAWEDFYRGIYMQQVVEDDQHVFDFATRDQLLISNLGTGRIFKKLDKEQRTKLETIEYIVGQHHQKGADELTHRRIKDFGFEALPFKKYSSNMTLYYLMLISYNLLEFFKRDVLGDQLKCGAYATTVRRQFIDFAAKFVRTGRRLIMKVTQTTMERLDLQKLWERCQAPVRLFP
jgi:hypothetical protein